MLGAILLLLLAGAPPSSQEGEAEPVLDGVAFHVDLPQGVVLTRRAVIDFDIYQVVENGRPLAGFYEGFAADVGAWVSDRRKEGRQEHQAENGAMEFFWNRNCMPTEVHGWIYPNLPSADAAKARSIVQSLEMQACD